MVRERGLEPPRPCEHYDLNVACLPISALARDVSSYILPLFTKIRKCETTRRVVFAVIKLPLLINFGYHVGRLAQLARAPRLHRGGRGFESLSAHHVHIRRMKSHISGIFCLLYFAY